MEFKKSEIILDDSHKLTDVPKYCPHCGLPTHLQFMTAVQTTKYDNKQIVIAVFKAECCNKYEFITYLNQDNKLSFLASYPNRIELLPESITSLSPRFVKLYSDSKSAYDHNMFELAGTGFRNSLEVLIKDYAINELEEDPDKVARIKLYDAIEKYLPDDRLKNAADVVRILGNDYTHYQRKYEQYDVEILKRYLDIFIKRIEVNYLMDHPPLSRHQKS